jgi:TatD DNase family protein
MPFLDAHIHLQDVPDDTFLTAVRSLNDLGGLFCCATRPADWEAVACLAEVDHRIVPFFGIHPWYATEAVAGWEQRLASYLERFPGAGIGEVGLDRGSRGVSFFDDQVPVFEVACRIGLEFRRPLIVHCVRAWGALNKVFGHSGWDGAPFIMHGFSGSREVMDELLERGAYFSFSCRALLPTAKHAVSALRAAPNDRLLLETDYPYAANSISAEGYRDQLMFTYRETGRLRSVDYDDLMKRVWKNGTVFSNQIDAG